MGGISDGVGLADGILQHCFGCFGGFLQQGGGIMGSIGKIGGSGCISPGGIAKVRPPADPGCFCGAIVPWKRISCLHNTVARTSNDRFKKASWLTVLWATNPFPVQCTQ